MADLGLLCSYPCIVRLVSFLAYLMLRKLIMLHGDVRLRNEHIGNPLKILGHMTDIVVGARGTDDVLI